MRALSFRTRLLTTYGLLILVSMGLLSGYLLYDSAQFYRRHATDDLRTQGHLLVLQARPLLIAQDRQGLTVLLREVNSGTRARFLIFDEQGILLAATDQADMPLIGTIPALPGNAEALIGRENSGQRTRPEGEQEILYSVTPVFAGDGAGRVLGVVRVSYALADMQAFERETIGHLLMGGMLVGTVAGLYGVLLANGVTRPLRAVRDTVAQLTLGQLEARVPPLRQDEVGRLATDINTLGARLEALEHQRREFTAEVSHDLNGLGAGIALTARVLQRLGPGHQERALQLLQALTDQTARLARLTDELLLHASTEAAERPPTLLPASLDDLVAAVMAEMWPLAAARDITLDYQRPTYPAGARVDVPLFTRAVANLLDNAIRHTPVGGRVTVRLATRGDRVALSIADTGPGIGAMELQRLFAPHYRDEADPARGGHGLGLAIVRRVVEAHGGEMRVDNASQGATFMILLSACPLPRAG